jgi:hypothetical protein
MYNSGEAAEQIVRMSLQGTEVALKISGQGAKHLAALTSAILSEKRKTAGKARLASMLKTGKELKVFNIEGDALKDFAKEAKRYGVLYCVLKDKNAQDMPVDIMVKSEDASKVNRIVEKLRLATVDVADVVADIEKNLDSQAQDVPDADVQTKDAEARSEEAKSKEPQTKEDRHNANPSAAKASQDSPSRKDSSRGSRSEADADQPSRKSVRKKIEDMRRQRAKNPYAPSRDTKGRGTDDNAFRRRIRKDKDEGRRR